MEIKRIEKLVLTGLCILMAPAVFAQGIFGEWKTIDDVSGKAKSVLEIYEQGDKVFAKVVQILEKGREDALCENCKGDLKDSPIMGMRIIDGLEKNGDLEYSGGTILDPENGKTYRCKIWVDPDNPDQLKVRGYLAFFYRTQTWHRIGSGQ